jgi:hypothetical protein
MIFGQSLQRIADLLTASRAIFGAIIILLGLGGKEALSLVVLLIIAGWTTDILDGRFARSAKANSTSDSATIKNSWISEHDFTFDMILVLSSLIYLTTVGFVWAPYSFVYLSVAALFIIWSSGSKSVIELLALPVVALPLIIAYFEEPWIAYVFGVWIILALIFCWSRFMVVIEDFIKGIKNFRKT